MKKYRGAIVGFGKVAEQAHVPGFRLAPGFEIAAVVDPSEERRAQALAALPGARAYADFAAAAEAEAKLDFVDVAAPPRFHAPVVTQALSRGLHVLCEKPLALDLAESADVARAVSDPGRKGQLVVACRQRLGRHRHPLAAPIGAHPIDHPIAAPELDLGLGRRPPGDHGAAAGLDPYDVEARRRARLDLGRFIWRCTVVPARSGRLRRSWRSPRDGRCRAALVGDRRRPGLGRRFVRG